MRSVEDPANDPAANDPAANDPAANDPAAANDAAPRQGRDDDAPSPTIDYASDQDRFKRLGELFDQAAELDDAQREAFLSELAVSDAALALDLASLLAHDRPGSGVFGKDAVGAIALGQLVAPALANAPDTGGRFRILRLIGEGGMARVYEAEQLVPRRRVALKFLRREAATERSLGRFRTEMEILARLQHPGIASVYEAVIDADEPYIVMELVQGIPLDDYADVRQLDLQARIELYAAVCDAVAFAHSQGVVHRDLKPANILVETTPSGTHVSASGRPGARPKILDFGIARVLDDDSVRGHTLTRTGELVGTPAYMSPEQTMMDPSKVGKAADVYALGVIGYELLTGQMPYPVQRQEIFVVLAHIRKTTPTSAGRIKRELRGDLEVILDKALEKEPERRYAHAGELADDLHRVLSHQPISARPPSSWYQLARFARRNRILVASFAAVMVVLIAGFAASLSFWMKAEAARNDLQARLDDLTLDHAREQLGLDPTAAVRSLAALSDEADWDRAWLIGWSAAGRGLAGRTLLGHDDTVEWVAGSPDGTLVATAGYDGTTRLWDLARGTSVVLPQGAPVNRAMWSPDGALLATVGRDAALRLWGRDGTLRGAFTTDDREHEIEDLAFSPDGQRILTGAATSIVWTLGAAPDGQLTATAQPLRPSRKHIDDVAWSADGRWLAATTRGAVDLWRDGELDARSLEMDGEVQVVAFTPDSKRLAAGDDNGVIRVWRAADGDAPVAELRQRGSVKGVVFVPGDRLAAIDRAGELRLHDLRDGTSRLVRDRGGVFRALVLSPDGKLLATASDDRTVGLYDLGTLDVRILRGHAGAVQHVAWIGSGRSDVLASSSNDGEVRLWSVSQERTRWDGFELWPRAAAGAPDGHALVAVDAGGWLRRFDAHGGGKLLAVEDDFFGVTWSTGDLIASGNRKGRIRVLTPDGDVTASFDIGTRPTHFAFSPDGTKLAIGTARPSTVVWDKATGATHEVPGRVERIVDVAWLDDQRVVYADRAGVLEVVSDGRGTPLAELGAVVSAIATDHTIVAVGTRGGDVALWTVGPTLAPGRKVHLPSPVWSVAVQRGKVAVGLHDGSVRLVSTRADDPAGDVLSPMPHKGPVKAVLFSPDGRFLASGGDDRRVHVWQVDGQTVHLIDLFEGPIASLAAVGDRFAVVSDESSLSLWPFDIASAPAPVRAYLDGLVKPD